MAIALLAVAAVVTAVGTLQAASAQSTQLKNQAIMAGYQKKVAERNQIVAQQNELMARQQASADAQDKRDQNKRQLGAIRSAYGSSGVDIAGSPMDVLEDSATMLEKDAKTTEYAGEVQARKGALEMLGYQDQAALLGMQSSSLNTEAGAVMTAGRLSALGSLFKGAGYAAMAGGGGGSTPDAKAWSNPDFAGGTQEEFGWAGNY